MTKRFLAAVVVASFTLAGIAHAEIIETTGTFGGTRVDYLVVLPDGFDPANEYPAVLAFAGGGQTMRTTRERGREPLGSGSRATRFYCRQSDSPNGAAVFPCRCVKYPLLSGRSPPELQD